jgi:N,N'-diacetyllegionaminate synthase
VSIFIIAEAGVNHNGSNDLAYQLIDCASKARADAVKFQSLFMEMEALQKILLTCSLIFLCQL